LVQLREVPLDWFDIFTLASEHLEASHFACRTQKFARKAKLAHIGDGIGRQRFPFLSFSFSLDGNTLVSGSCVGFSIGVGLISPFLSSIAAFFHPRVKGRSVSAWAGRFCTFHPLFFRAKVIGHDMRDRHGHRCGFGTVGWLHKLPLSRVFIGHPLFNHLPFL
jgi:hypothetical protein